MEALSAEQQRIVSEIVSLGVDHRRFHSLDYYEPYLKQREFHRLGSSCSIRALIAGNQVGKSHAGGAEDTFHATGLYPKWWDGCRFDHPVKMWVVGVNAEKVRDTLQSTLFGPWNKPGDIGTGMIPREAIIGRPTLGKGVSQGFDTASVKWADKNGRLDDSAVSTITFKSLTEALMSFASDTIDVVHQDEEPDLEKWTEERTRIQVKKGIIYLTTTPLLGWTPIITELLKEPQPNMAAVKMGLYDAMKGHDPQRPYLGHYDSKEQCDAIIAGFPPHLRNAKAYGEPALGEGKIFLTPEANYTIQRPDFIAPHWRKIWGIDFGGAGENSHPFAAALLCHDVDYDILYVLHTLKLQGMSLLQHVPKMREIAPNVPVAWPHDGNAVDGRGSGTTLAEAYRKPHPGMPGLNMLPDHATWEGGGFELQPGIDDLDSRMQTGRLKVCMDLLDFFDEARQYHREKFKVVKLNDDILSAVFKGLMMLRYAKPGYLIEPKNGKYAKKADEWWKPTHTVTDFDPFTGRVISQGEEERNW